MADTNGPPPMKRVEVKVPFPNNVGHACKVFAIHMGILIVFSILLGIFWEMTAMWVVGGSNRLASEISRLLKMIGVGKARGNDDEAALQLCPT